MFFGKIFIFSRMAGDYLRFIVVYIGFSLSYAVPYSFWMDNSTQQQIKTATRGGRNYELIYAASSTGSFFLKKGRLWEK